MFLQRSPGCHRRPSGRHDHDDRLDDHDSALARRIAVHRRRRHTAWCSQYLRDHLSGNCGLYRSNWIASDKGCCVGAMALLFNGRRHLYGLQLSAEPHDEPRPIGVLVMVEVEELRDPAACIPTVRQALDCSRSCGLARSTNMISRLVKFHLGTWRTGWMCWDSPWRHWAF